MRNGQYPETENIELNALLKTFYLKLKFVNQK